jgi:hypothetical protein
MRLCTHLYSNGCCRAILICPNTAGCYIQAKPTRILKYQVDRCTDHLAATLVGSSLAEIGLSLSVSHVMFARMW